MTQDRESLIEEMTMAVGGVDDTLRHGDLRTCPACRARATAAMDALLAQLRDPSESLVQALHRVTCQSETTVRCFLRDLAGHLAP